MLGVIDLNRSLVRLRIFSSGAPFHVCEWRLKLLILCGVDVLVKPTRTPCRVLSFFTNDGIKMPQDVT